MRLKGELMSRKRIISVVGAGIAALLAGCSAPAGYSVSHGDGVTITFDHWGVNTEAATFTSMVKLFEKQNPKIKIQDNWIQSDYEQRLTASVAGGQAPDVAQISNTYLSDFQHVLKPMSVKPSDYFTSNISRGMELNGTYYGVPFVVKPNVLAVNEDLFEKNHVAVPSSTTPMSVNSFAQTAEKLTSGSGKKKVYGSAPLWYNEFLKAEGGDFFTPQGTCTLATPAAIAAAKLMIKAQSSGGFAPTLLDSQGQDMFYWLSVGRLAMQPQFGPWDVSKLVGLKSSAFQLVPVPGEGSQLEVDGLSVFKSTDPTHAAAAEKFIRFMSTNTQAQSLLTTKQASMGVPVTPAALKGFYATAPHLNLKAFVVAAGQSKLGASVKSYGDITGNIGSALSSRTAMGSGHENPAKVLSDLQSRCPTGLQ
jgi:multiple sugar transport system substrate-binding protein